VKASGLNLEQLQDLVLSNDKQRYDLILEGSDGEILETVCTTRTLKSQASKKGVWLIRARQGHSVKVKQLSNTINTIEKHGSLSVSAILHAEAVSGSDDRRQVCQACRRWGETTFISPRVLEETI
jgi:RNA:NAD 2'-phosphotransferase (TPT1/KptA family)